MGRPKAHPNLPEYMVKIGSAYKIKRPVPEHAWDEFPELKGKARVKVVSLGTDERGAKRRFLTEIEAIEARIERGIIKAPLSVQPIMSSEPRLYQPMEIVDAIDLWQRKRIDTNRRSGQERELKELHGIETPREDFNGRDLLSHRLEAIRTMASRIIREQSGHNKGRHIVGFDISRFSERGEFDAYNAIPDFQEKFALALNSEGVNLRPYAPILSRAFAVETFAAAWARVVHSELHWLCGSELYRVEEEGDEVILASQKVRNSPLTTIIGVDTEAANQVSTLSKLFEYYKTTSDDPKNMDKKRQWWNLLIRNFGDVSPSDLTVFRMKAFRTSLRSAPKTRKPSFEALPLREQIARSDELADAGGTLKPRSDKTIYDYFGFYHGVFELAKKDKIISENPVEGVKPAKPKKGFKSRKIKSYSDDDIAQIFSTPLFMGCDKIRSKTKEGGLYGYRDRAGKLIEKDGRYFMPLLALLSGARMEEWGGARVSDIKLHQNIWFLDLTARSLKTESSKRLVPLHPRLTDPSDLNFLGYWNDRKKNGDEFLFPEFKPVGVSEAALKDYVERLRKNADNYDPLDETDIEVLKMTATYSKWFGLWCDKHGFRDPDKNFHSFRHTFKNRIRGKAAEDVHDSITGHANTNHIGREYGGDYESLLIELPEYYSAVCKVHYSTLPKFP